MSSVRRVATLTAVAVALLSAVVLALALTASPASAFTNWQHNGTAGCVCHAQGTPTDASCTRSMCHAGFQSFPDETCWSCHEPGKPTAGLSTPSSACSQECHLWSSVQKQYITPSTHGTDPHLGSSSECLGCHPTSVGISDPGSSPHHSGQATGFSSCGACHSSPQKHAGKVACTSCHTDAQAFHLYEASDPGSKKCGSLPHHEARRGQGRREQVRAVSQGELRPHRTALLVGDQEVRVQRLPQQEAARQCREQQGEELPHVSHRQVPRRAAHARQVGVHGLPQHPQAPR